MTSSAGRPWDGIDLWRSHKQLRETLTEAEEAEFDDYLGGAREADLEERRAEIEEELPEVDLDQPIPDEQLHTLPEADLDRVVDWQYDQDILREERERAASDEEFAEAMRQAAGPPPPLTAQQRFEIGFSTTGEISPEMREWEIAADQALSAQFGQQIVGQWMFGLSAPMLLSAADELHEGAEVIGPAGSDYEPGDRMIRIPTARRKYRIDEDGKFLGQFAYDDAQAATLLYVTYYQNAGTYNIPTTYGVAVDVSTDRIFTVSTSRAPKELMDAVRAENDGHLTVDVDGQLRLHPEILAAEPKTMQEAMQLLAQRLGLKPIVAPWVNDPQHVLNPTARAQRRDLFAPVEDRSPGATPPPAPPSPLAPDAPSPDGDAEPELTPEEKRAYNEQRISDLIETVEQDLPPEESWSGIDEEGNTTPPPESADPSAAAGEAASSFFSGRWLIAAIVAGFVVAALLGFAFLGGGDDTSEVPADTGDAEASGGTDSSGAVVIPTGQRTPDGQVPQLPEGWQEPPAFARVSTDIEDPTVRWSSGGALWAWSTWTTAEITSELEEVDADFALVQSSLFDVGTSIPNELVIDADCSGGSCQYSTLHPYLDPLRRDEGIADDIQVDLTLNGLTLTGEFQPLDDLCVIDWTFTYEVTDLTVINNRLVPDFIRGERTLTRECVEFEERQVIEINGRYLFRGSYADQ